MCLSHFHGAEVTVILLIEFAVGIMAIAAGFGYKHTYVVRMASKECY